MSSNVLGVNCIPNSEFLFLNFLLLVATALGLTTAIVKYKLRAIRHQKLTDQYEAQKSQLIQLRREYKKELIMNLPCCNTITYSYQTCNAVEKRTCKEVEQYFKKVCSLIIDIKQCNHWVQSFGRVKNHVLHSETGTPGIIVIHTSDRAVKINIFSNKELDSNNIIQFTENWFRGKHYNHLC